MNIGSELCPGLKGNFQTGISHWLVGIGDVQVLEVVQTQLPFDFLDHSDGRVGGGVAHCLYTKKLVHNWAQFHYVKFPSGKFNLLEIVMQSPPSKLFFPLSSLFV